MIYLYTVGIAWAAYMLGYTVAKVRMEQEIREIALAQTKQHIEDLTGGGNTNTA